MEKVLDSINENKTIILFIILVLFATMYMGLSERRLNANISNSNPAVLEIK